MANESSISRAFILGAGLGTRLRPFTTDLPKPLVPVWNAPLITFAFDHLIHDCGISKFMINTHHAAERYEETFPEESYRGASIEFRHETVLLDTAGGLDNIRDWLPQNESFVVYNGDILTDLPLQPAVEFHQDSDYLVTLILRSGGHKPNVGFDEKNSRVTDMRNALGTNSTDLYQFTGIYLVSPDFLRYLKPGKIESVVIPFLEAIRDGNRIGGLVIDDGKWSDLGDPDSYLDALSLFRDGAFPRYGMDPPKSRIHPSASIAESAVIDDISTVGARAVIGEGAKIRESAIWSGVKVAEGSEIDREMISH